MAGTFMDRAWAIAWRNLRRNRRRNIATAAAIALGYAGLVLIGGYSYRVERFLRTNAIYLQHAGHVTVWLAGGREKAGAEPEKLQLDPAAQEKILAWAAADPRVEFGAPYLRGVGLAGNGCATQTTALLGVEPKLLRRIISHPEVAAWSSELSAPVSGRWIDEYPDVQRPAAVAAGLASMLEKPRVHDETRGLPPAPTVLDCDGPAEKDQLARDADVQLAGITYDGTFNALDTEMVATFHASDTLGEDGTMIVSLGTLRELYATDRATYVALYLRHDRDAPAVAEDLTRALSAAGLAVEALPWNDERNKPYYVGTVAFLGAVTGFITALVVLVLVLTVLGAMTLTILERTREIGTWRALGFHRGHVVSLVVREALLLAAVGIALGLVLGVAASIGVSAAGIRYAPPGVPGTIQLIIRPAPWTCALQAALILPGVCLAAWAVARAQARRNVVELLTAQTG